MIAGILLLNHCEHSIVWVVCIAVRGVVDYFLFLNPPKIGGTSVLKFYMNMD